MPKYNIVGVIGASHTAPPAPPDRGPLIYDKHIVDRYFLGLPNVKNKVRWVREHLPPSTRVTIGRYSAWYERDILAYIESLRGAKHTRRTG
jgi:hypothetical protein